MIWSLETNSERFMIMHVQLASQTAMGSNHSGAKRKGTHCNQWHFVFKVCRRAKREVTMVFFLNPWIGKRMPMFFYASGYSIYSTTTTDIFTTAIFFSSFIYSQQSFQYPPVSEFSRYFITAELADDFHLLSTVVHWQARAMPLPSQVLYHRRQPPRVRKSVTFLTNLFIVSIQNSCYLKSLRKW